MIAWKESAKTYVPVMAHPTLTRVLLKSNSTSLFSQGRSGINKDISRI
jgi:hypothetical protein